MPYAFNPFTGTFDLTSASGAISGSGTAGQVGFWSTATNITSETTGFRWDTTNKRLGIGTDTPSFGVEVAGATGTPATLAVTMAPASGATGPSLRWRSSTGTLGSPGATASGNLLGDFLYQGHDGSNYVTSSRLIAVADETFGVGTTRGSHLEFRTVAPGGSISTVIRAQVGGTSVLATTPGAGYFRLYASNNDITHYTEFVCPALANSLSYILPNVNAVGSLANDGVGNLSWSASGSGATGPMGMMGLDGLDGDDGMIGPPGIQGATGSTGATGAQGIMGTHGLDGVDGEDGMMGMPGIQGLQGIQGLMGMSGFDGVDGEDSFIAGPRGLTGTTGAAGIPGLDGADADDFAMMTIGGRPFDHHADLKNFIANDDHTQYALLAGRSGGQVLLGGTGTGDNLTLDAWTTSTQSDGFVDIKRRMRYYTQADTITTAMVANNLFPSGVTLGASGAFNALNIGTASSVYSLTGASPSSGLMNVFNLTGIVRNASGGNLSTGASLVYADGITFDINNNSTFTIGHLLNDSTIASHMAVAAYPGFTHSTGSGTGTIGDVVGLWMGNVVNVLGTVNAGWTVSRWAGLYMTPPGHSTPASAGTITELVGVDLADFNGRGGTNISLRSLGGTVELDHAGPALFGATGSPTTTQGNTIEVKHTTTITGAVTDGFAAGVTLNPTYSGAFTVTRHNYIDVRNPTLSSSTLTDAAMLRFDAAAGTHKAVDGATTKTTPGGVQAWLKINVNGTLHFMPCYTSKTA